MDWSRVGTLAAGLTAALTVPPTQMPTLEQFSASVVDPAVNPCDDFYQYVWADWMAANPIPSDQAAWGTGSGLRLSNETLLVLHCEQVFPDGAEGGSQEGRPADARRGHRG